MARDEPVASSYREIAQSDRQLVYAISVLAILFVMAGNVLTSAQTRIRYKFLMYVELVNRLLSLYVFGRS